MPVVRMTNCQRVDKSTLPPATNVSHSALKFNSGPHHVCKSIAECMHHCDLLMHVGDSKKLVCHCLPDILFAGNPVVANLGCCDFWRISLHVTVHPPAGSSCLCCRSQSIQTDQLVLRDSFGRMSPSAQLWGLLSGLTTQLLGTQAWLRRVLNNRFLLYLTVTWFSCCAQSFQSIA